MRNGRNGYKYNSSESNLLYVWSEGHAVTHKRFASPKIRNSIMNSHVICVVYLILPVVIESIDIYISVEFMEYDKTVHLCRSLFVQLL